MSTTFETIIDAHLRAWNSADTADRTAAIASIYAPDVFVGEPDSAHTGHEGVAQAIAGLQAQLPGTVLTRSGAIQIAQDMATYGWNLGPVDGDTIVTGRDVLLIRDGLISSLYVVIDAAP